MAWLKGKLSKDILIICIWLVQCFADIYLCQGHMHVYLADVYFLNNCLFCCRLIGWIIISEEGETSKEVEVDGEDSNSFINVSPKVEAYEEDIDYNACFL